MKARISLLDGAVVEVDGTALEISSLLDALRRSGHLAPTEPDAGVLDSARSDRSKAGDALEAGDGLRPPSGGEVAPTWDSPPETPEFEDDDVPAPFVVPGRAAPGNPVPPLDLVVREFAERFRLLADPTRLQILTLLADRGRNVGELCERLDGMSQPSVSHHLALLRVSGLIRPSREGKFNYYDLTEQGRTLTERVGRFGSPDGARAVELFRQASDPTRLLLLSALSESDRNVSELCDELGGISQPAVSHHLAKMRACGLVEHRRAGKFVYYSLRDEGRELTRMVAPMMEAKARAVSGPVVEPDDAEAIDFSEVPDDWMHTPPLTDDDAGEEDATGAGGAPPAHMLCRRVLVMVQELHRRGYERLRAAPGLSPSGLHWRCSVVPAGRVRRDHGALAVDGGGTEARYDSSHGARFFDWRDAESDSPVALAGKFLERFPGLAAEGAGADPDYARWYAGMLRATAPDGLIYAYADWDLPEDHIPALGCTADVKVPLPPPGERRT